MRSLRRLHQTSTGKVEQAATMPVTLVMVEATREVERATGRQVAVILYETLGPRWMSPDWFRFGGRRCSTMS